MALNIVENHEKGTVTIEGTEYAEDLFRPFGCDFPSEVGSILRIDRMEDGVVTVTRLRENWATLAPDIPEFSQGVWGDGAAILMNGQPLTIEDILGMLRCGARDAKDAHRYRKLRARNWSEQGITVVANPSSIKPFT